MPTSLRTLPERKIVETRHSTLIYDDWWDDGQHYVIADDDRGRLECMRVTPGKLGSENLWPVFSKQPLIRRLLQLRELADGEQLDLTYRQTPNT